MLRQSQRLCKSCSYQLLNLFTNGLVSPVHLSRYGGKSPLRHQYKSTSLAFPRTFTNRRVLKASVEDNEPYDDERPRSPAQIEAIVRQARQTFGETLPENFLSEEEYQVYERLYGPPSATTLPEDVDLLKGVVEEEGAEGEEVDQEALRNVLFREDKDGNLEEVVFEEDSEEDLEVPQEVEEGADQDFTDEDIVEELNGAGTREGSVENERMTSTDPVTEEEFRARMKHLHDQCATRKTPVLPEENQAEEDMQINEVVEESSEIELAEEGRLDEDIEGEGNEYYKSDTIRAHTLTSSGHFGTSPSTLQLPKDTHVEPIATLLADASNKHLGEVAQKAFGGHGLPNSTATIRRPNLVQQTIPLEASQGRMGEMEANAYLAAIYPGAHASIMSTLVEVRKRLGSDWLRGIMSQPSGPRILDAGSGGAAVLAWREVIQAEYAVIYAATPPKSTRPPFGKSTVVTGSAALRLRASALLDDTSFIPRLPDYDPSRDHPSLEASNPQPRKQYDIIIAPYTLWSLKEDHMRKSQIQNFWSLLDPHGGVLILIEKGVPRGFELIAGARETLLKHHISSPGSELVENTVESANPNRFTHKEKGMIIAPCTNHGKCPMYITAGRSQGRKDFCHFNQRFIRPPYLQRILGQSDRNHEDISFSYVAFQRGRDMRQEESFEQGIVAADAAFEGYEEYDAEYDARPPNLLSMPRAILPPIKRRGHVILDLCTPAGKIERWTVPKSFSKQAYRDARKSKWGDLWALGAKTRVGRNIRVGLKKREDKMRQADLDEPTEELDEEELEATKNSERRNGIKAKASARDRKGRSGRSKYSKKAPVVADMDEL